MAKFRLQPWPDHVSDQCRARFGGMAIVVDPILIEATADRDRQLGAGVEEIDPIFAKELIGLPTERNVALIHLGGDQCEALFRGPISDDEH